MGYYNSFIVRVWTDDIDGPSYGLIQHVSTQEKAYFADQYEMDEFISSHLEPPALSIPIDETISTGDWHVEELAAGDNGTGREPPVNLFGD